MQETVEKIKFGTDGWRAIIAEGFTFNRVQIASNAIGQYIVQNCKKELPVIIGFDTRFLAQDFARTCANELLKLGLKVQLSNTAVPTPVIAYHAANYPGGTNGAIQFTASHNPPEYCGLKYITNYGGPAPVEITQKITEIINSLNPENLNLADNVKKEIAVFSPKEKYISHIKGIIDFEKIKKASLKVVYDPMYGAGNGFLDDILKLTNCNTITLHNIRDPLFGNSLPEPREEYLDELKKCVIENKADIGLATDGDSDRLSAIDNNGNFFSPNKISSMLLRHLVKNKKLKGAVVRTLSTTHLMDYIAKKYDLEIIETKVGFKWICEEMRKKEVLIGAEESGGISIINHVPDKDAILAGMLLVEMLAYEKKSLAEIYDETLKDANWNCINDKIDLHINENERQNFNSTLNSGEAKQFPGLDIVSVKTIEGAKYILKDGSWFFARLSGTEPMARVYFEATSSESLNNMKSAVKKIINQICQK